LTKGDLGGFKKQQSEGIFGKSIIFLIFHYQNPAWEGNASVGGVLRTRKSAGGVTFIFLPRFGDER
jgi:hypothetical protein